MILATSLHVSVYVTVISGHDEVPWSPGVQASQPETHVKADCGQVLCTSAIKLPKANQASVAFLELTQARLDTRWINSTIRIVQPSLGTSPTGRDRPIMC